MPLTMRETKLYEQEGRKKRYVVKFCLENGLVENG